MRRRDRIALILVASVLVVAPFALGGAPRWAICVTSLLAAAAAASFFTSQREMSTLSPLLLFVWVATLLTLLQVVPLPAGLVALISPGKHQLVADNAHALGGSTPSFMALSLDPPATLLELAKLFGYVAFAYAALRVAATPPRRQWLLSIVALVGAAMAATTLLHLAVGAESVFGLYRPHEAMVRPTLAPLLNHNHLSALMALSAPIAVGLAVAATARLRLAWVAVAALCAGVGLLAESRGGALALVLGLVALAVLATVQRRGPRPQSKMSRADMIAIAVVSMCGLVLLGVLTAGGVVRDLSTTSLGEMSQSQSRFGVWRASATLLHEFRWTGIGRGAFEAASTRVHDSSAVVYPHVENEYLQAVIDWGFVGAAGLALILVWLAAAAVRNARASAWEAGAFAGMVALAVENLTDFSLWMPGVAYPALAVLAALTAGPVAVSTRLGRRVLRPVRAGAIVTVVVAVAVAASRLGAGAREETDELAARHDTRGAPDAAVARAAEVFARHPSDYVAAGMTARALFVARDHRAIAVVNRALALHPTSGDLHRLTAQLLLASQQRAQARTEFALALRYRPSADMFDEILATFPSDDDAMRALPLQPSMIREWSDRLRQRGRTPLAIAYLRRYLSLFPQDGAIQLYAASVALAAGDLELATSSSQRAYDLDPTPAAAIVVAQALSREGKRDRALALLGQVLDRPRRPLSPGERVELHIALADALVAEGSLDAARQSLRIALEIAQGRQLAQVHRRIGDIEERLGNAHQAAWERERAAELDR